MMMEILPMLLRHAGGDPLGIGAFLAFALLAVFFLAGVGVGLVLLLIHILIRH